MNNEGATSPILPMPELSLEEFDSMPYKSKNLRRSKKNVVPPETDSWPAIKENLKRLPMNQLMGLLKNLYSLNDASANFIEAKVDPKRGLQIYKRIVKRNMYPDINDRETVSLSKAKKAISDFTKATNNAAGTIELMMTYVEEGHLFTMHYGSLYEQFYDSLMSMFQRLLKKIVEDDSLIDKYYDRLEKIAEESKRFGWGYEEMFTFFCDFKKSIEQ